MPKQLITSIAGTAIPYNKDNIDTDRIIPARFMKCVTFDGLGEYAFYDERFEADGSPKGHPFDDARYKDGTILLAGVNFGCGSSREHAPQALQKWGIQAVIGLSFAEIFFGNCTTLGIPCVTVTEAELAALTETVQQSPETEVCIDLAAKTITAGEKQWPMTMPEGARESLVTGNWDSLAILREAESEIAAVAGKLAYF